MAEQPLKQHHHLGPTQRGGKPKFVMGSRGKSLALMQPGRYFVEVAGLVPHVICDPAELASDEVRDVLPHVFLFIFLPSHVVFLLALLCPPWSSLVVCPSFSCTLPHVEWKRRKEMAGF